MTTAENDKGSSTGKLNISSIGTLQALTYYTLIDYAAYFVNAWFLLV